LLRDCIARGHVALKLLARDVRSHPILLALYRSLTDPIVELSPAHPQDLNHLKYLKAQWCELIVCARIPFSSGHVTRPAGAKYGDVEGKSLRTRRVFAPSDPYRFWSQPGKNRK
jgi:hypothetical protein